MSVAFRKVSGFSKGTLLHERFSSFLNFTNGTKSRITSLLKYNLLKFVVILGTYFNFIKIRIWY